MQHTEHDPFNGPEPASMPLARNRLARVICQISYPPVLSVQDRNFIGPFQEAIRSAYPIFGWETVRNVNIGPQGPSVSDDVMWRFSDAKGTWRVTLTSTFLSLETGEYVSRADFMRRLDVLVEALAGTIRPSHLARLGVRYVNQFPLSTRAEAAGVFRDGLVGSDILAASCNPSSHHLVCQSASALAEGGVMQVKWGMLPPGGSHDGNVMQPSSTDCCFLDIDAVEDSRAAMKPFQHSDIGAAARRLAARCHVFFRWAVSDACIAELSAPSPGGNEGFPSGGILH